MKSADQYVAVSLDLLTSEQIDQYLESHRVELELIGITEPRDVRLFMDRVYDLHDLMQRPILVEMLMELVLRRSLDVYSATEQMTAAEIYELYCEDRLVSEWERGDRKYGLDSIQRRQFAERSAWEMNVHGTLELKPFQARAIVERMIKARSRQTREESVDRALSDVRTCSFLTIDDEGNLRFIHKSFMEYFVAWQMVDAMAEHRPLPVVTTAVPDEAIYFLGAMAIPAHRLHSARTLRSNLKTTLHELLSVAAVSVAHVGNSNVVGALMHADPVVSGVRFATAQPCRTPWRSREFRDCYFDELHLVGVDLESLTCSYGTRGGKLTVRGNCDVLRLNDANVELIDQEGGMGSVEFVHARARLQLRDIDSVSISVSLRDYSDLTIRPVTTAGNPRLDVSCEGSALLLDYGCQTRRLGFVDSRVIVRLLGPQDVPTVDVNGLNSVLLLDFSESASEAGVDASGYGLRGRLDSCLILVPPTSALEWLNNLDLDACLIVGGVVGRDDPYP